MLCSINATLGDGSPYKPEAFDSHLFCVIAPGIAHINFQVMTNICMDLK
jgi:hypothetical protein